MNYREMSTLLPNTLTVPKFIFYRANEQSMGSARGPRRLAATSARTALRGHELPDQFTLCFSNSSAKLEDFPLKRSVSTIIALDPPLNRLLMRASSKSLQIFRAAHLPIWDCHHASGTHCAAGDAEYVIIISMLRIT